MSEENEREREEEESNESKFARLEDEDEDEEKATEAWHYIKVFRSYYNGLWMEPMTDCHLPLFQSPD